MSLAKRILHLVDWSARLVPYGEALRLQESQAILCKQRLIHDTLILLQVWQLLLRTSTSLLQASLFV